MNDLIIECLMCNKHYEEKPTIVEICPHCGNPDKEKTIYLDKGGSIYQSIKSQMAGGKR